MLISVGSECAGLLLDAISERIVFVIALGTIVELQHVAVRIDRHLEANLPKQLSTHDPACAEQEFALRFTMIAMGNRLRTCRKTPCSRHKPAFLERWNMPCYRCTSSSFTVDCWPLT